MKTVKYTSVEERDGALEELCQHLDPGQLVLWSFGKPVSNITYLKTLLTNRGIILTPDLFPERVLKKAGTLGALQRSLTDALFTVNVHAHIVRQHSKIAAGAKSDYASFGEGWQNIRVYEEPVPDAHPFEDKPADIAAGTW